jgi:hypothetical protein
VKPQLEQARDKLLLRFGEAEQQDAVALLHNLDPAPGVNGWGKAWLQVLIELNIIFRKMETEAFSLGDPQKNREALAEVEQTAGPEMRAETERQNLAYFRSVLAVGQALQEFRTLLAKVLETGMLHG